MKIKKGFVVREIAGQNIVIALGEATKTFNGMIQLNDTGAFLWKLLEKGAEEDQLVEQMMKEYGIERDVAKGDVQEFIQGLKEANLLQ